MLRFIPQLNRKFIQNKLSIIFCFALAGLSAACLSSQSQQQTGEQPDAVFSGEQRGGGQPQSAAGQATQFQFPVADGALPKAIDLSRAAPDVALQENIQKKIEASEFRNARWGVFVTSLKDGRVLAALDAQKTFNPASAQKLLTTAVALDKLGADFRWRTSVLAERDVDAGGTLDGDLVLYGRGAPDFDEADMNNLVEQLKQKGLRRVAGNVIGEAGYFRASTLGAGWVWEEAQWYYGAEPSALSYSDNTVLVEVVPSDKLNEPATVKTTPEASFIQVTNNAMTTAGASNQTFGVHRDLEANNFKVWGEVPRGKSMGLRTTMHQPELWAASDLKKVLERNGIAVAGAVKNQDWRTSNLDVSNLKELAAVESDSLAEVVKRTNKHSVNLNSELMLRTLGRRAREAAEQRRERKTVMGDDQLGAQVIKNWLAEKSVELGDTVIQDGSGLSRLNFITPETMGRLLVHAARMKTADVFRDSLPISGTDGTLGGRLAKFKGNVIAKTGTVTYVSALAGYAQTRDGEILSFTIFCNNETRKADAVAVIDQIASLIADYPNNSAEDSTSDKK